MNLLTPTGTVHSARSGRNPFDGTQRPRPMPRCGTKFSRFLIDTERDVTCKNCLAKIAKEAA